MGLGHHPNVALSTTNGAPYSRSSVPTASAVNRGYPNADRATAAPPIVVVSPDVSSEPIERHSLDGSLITPPRTNALGARGLRPAPKDTIPITGKPRKQRSSRFVVTEKVEIEKLPAFAGQFIFFRHPSYLISRCRVAIERAATAVYPEAAPMRRDL